MANRLFFCKSLLTAMDIAVMDWREEGRIKRIWWQNAQKIKVFRVIPILLDTHLTSLWFPVSEKGMKAVKINFMPHWEKKIKYFSNSVWKATACFISFYTKLNHWVFYPENVLLICSHRGLFSHDIRSIEKKTA